MRVASVFRPERRSASAPTGSRRTTRRPTRRGSSRRLKVCASVTANGRS